MNPQLVEAAAALVHVLTVENEALTALDLPRAAGLLPEKIAAIQAFAEAEKLTGSGTLGSEQHTRAQTIALRLRALGDENRRLLERALLVQRRVIGTVARAVPRAAAGNTARYQSSGALSGPNRPLPVALLARA